MKVTKATTTKIGREGEELAKEYLQKLGYTIKESNFRYKRAEIDIIAQKEAVLVFVEVKKRKNADYGLPEYFVNNKKAELIHLAATYYLEQNPWVGPIRFDIVAITANEILILEDAF